MATVTEEGVEYESDPKEPMRSLTIRRRRDASDDEESDADADVDERDAASDRLISHFVDSDGEGGVVDYHEEEVFKEEDVEEEEEEEDVEEEERSQHEGGVIGIVVNDSGDADVKAPLEESGSRDEEEKKKNEPFAVPTAGTLYMHDDRFRDNASAHHRRMTSLRSKKAIYVCEQALGCCHMQFICNGYLILTRDCSLNKGNVEVESPLVQQMANSEVGHSPNMGQN